MASDTASKGIGKLLRASTLTRVVPGLDLLLQVMLHAHGQLVELVPLLGEPHCAVLRVAVVQDKVLLQSRSYKTDRFSVKNIKNQF